MKILLTAFEPFDNERLNPSLEVAHRLAELGARNAELVVVVLPVVRFACLAQAIAALNEHKPDAVIMLGQANGRSRITVERVAINIDDFRLADNAGNRPIDEPVIDGGPAGFFCTLPIKRMVARMIENGLPAGVSNTAGTFVCNHLTYGLMHHLWSNGKALPAGFIHLPLLPEQVANKDDGTPSMSVETMVMGIRLCCEALAEVLQA